MGLLYLLIIVATLVVIAALLAFRWAVRTGQFDDLDTPSIRVILDDQEPKSSP